MPFIPQDVLDRLTGLERQVKQLTGRANIRPALNQVLSGDVTVGEGGQLRVKAASGIEHFRVGHLGTYYQDEDGKTAKEFGTIIRRRDGSVALSIWNGQDAVNPQVLRLSDAKGNDIFAENIENGGLHRPHLAQPWIDSQPHRWPSTDSTSFELLQEAHVETEHAKVRIYVQTTAVGAGGELRLSINGSTIHTSSGLIDETFTVPNFQYGELIRIELHARAKGAGSTVWATFVRLHSVG
ncbi:MULTISPECIES: hypothetical protein [Streptomyces]|uniref:hypothetical protein n=1 Tax=Streptomyces TaxID=1883 RepID=UPI000C27FB61|nr:hypothetical protein [Streptomyces sp. CB02120-2]PJN19265.1 hypothetical protein CG724_10955 [Streptomyces sp. CB02120-2]